MLEKSVMQTGRCGVCGAANPKAAITYKDFATGERVFIRCCSGECHNKAIDTIREEQQKKVNKKRILAYNMG